MWVRILWMLVLVAGQCCSQDTGAPFEGELQVVRDDDTLNPDSNFIYVVSREIENRMEILLGQLQQNLEARFNLIEKNIAESSSGADREMTNPFYITDEFHTKVTEMLHLFTNMVSTKANETIRDMEDKLNTLSNNLISRVEAELSPVSSAMDDLKEEMSSLATKTELTEMKDSLSTVANSSVKELKQTLSSLATQTQLSANAQQQAVYLKEVKHLLTNSCIASADNQKEALGALLTSVDSNSKKMDELSGAVQTSATHCTEHTSDTANNLTQLINVLTENVSNYDASLSDITEDLVNVVTLMETKLAAVEDKVAEIHSNTQPAPTTTTTTTTKAPAILRPCENSDFKGSADKLDVCNAAVRFKKCHLQFVAFHCCRSCTEAGQIEGTGPWRYLNYPRQISIFQALSQMRP
ncbi:uncharacterized protein LOC121864929 [Homarus americanus]|uniref:PLAC domain-containing protein n=1 Tax=Homarus americanus TaxID=6706 RepID=A0A8J5N024_HOMAM|nr:uncharacterized protein LOC121864929 [Homarus americanus]KAG7169999.1 hypothetical protein Hamer_G012219 [Homarus americanus]